MPAWQCVIVLLAGDFFSVGSLRMFLCGLDRDQRPSALYTDGLLVRSETQTFTLPHSHYVLSLTSDVVLVLHPGSEPEALFYFSGLGLERRGFDSITEPNPARVPGPLQTIPAPICMHIDPDPAPPERV